MKGIHVVDVINLFGHVALLAWIDLLARQLQLGSYRASLHRKEEPTFRSTLVADTLVGK